MGYYQGSNNVYSKFDRPHYEIMPYPINYNQGGHDGTAGFGNDGDCTILQKVLVIKDLKAHIGVLTNGLITVTHKIPEQMRLEMLICILVISIIKAQFQTEVDY